MVGMRVGDENRLRRLLIDVTGPIGAAIDDDPAATARHYEGRVSSMSR